MVFEEADVGKPRSVEFDLDQVESVSITRGQGFPQGPVQGRCFNIFRLLPLQWRFVGKLMMNRGLPNCPVS